MIIGVVSAKGGVGKTTFVSNVGMSLAYDFNKKVLLIDGNITTPTLGIHVGILSQEKTIHDVLNGIIDIRNATYIHPFGPHIIPASLSPTENYPNPDVLKEKLNGVTNSYDFIFIDGAAGIGREVIATLKASEEVIVVTNPEMTALISAAKVIKLARNLEVPIMGVVVNKVMGTKHEMKRLDIEEICEAKVIAEVPLDKKIPESIKSMTPVVVYDRNSPAAKAFKKIAAYISGGGIEEKESFWEKIKRFFSLRS